MIVVNVDKVNDGNTFQIANEEEESTFCLEHGMEYARDNPQKVKYQFKLIEKFFWQVKTPQPITVIALTVKKCSK